MADEERKALIGTGIESVPKSTPEIGIDTDEHFADTIIDAAETSQLDLGQIESFTTVAQTRDTIYSTVDTMSQDSSVAAILKTYTSDIVAPNDAGQKIWVEATDADISKYANHLLEDLDVNDNLYDWVYSLLKYGDLYIKLYRESDVEKLENPGVALDKENKGQLKVTKSLKESIEEALKAAREDPNLEDKAKVALEKAHEEINEAVKMKLHPVSDNLVNFVEKYPNPAEIFELTQLGKTEGFIKAPVISTSPYDTNNSSMYNYLRYEYKQKDVTFYGPGDFIHVFLPDNSGRVPEKVNISLDKEETGDNADVAPFVYKVRRGLSILADKFKIWRQLSLLENALLLSRVTRSAIVRVLNIDIGDMGKEAVGSFIERLKSKIEQKSALNTDVGMAEYVNPGPIENIIYVPTHNGQGTITANVIGGDYDPKALTDLEYFRDKFYGAFGVPKQYFGYTCDGAGFNGGASLSIISSIYAKDVIRFQGVVCTFVKTLLNIFFLDRGLTSYINNFSVKMQAPVTQDDIDRRNTNDSRVRYVQDVSNLLASDISKVALLKIKKHLLTPIINDPEVFSILEDEITRLEDEGEETPKPKDEGERKMPRRSGPEPEVAIPGEEEPATPRPTLGGKEETPVEGGEETPTEVVGEPESYLPSFNELGISGVDNQ